MTKEMFKELFDQTEDDNLLECILCENAMRGIREENIDWMKEAKSIINTLNFLVEAGTYKIV